MTFHWDIKQYHWVKELVDDLPAKPEWTTIENGKEKIVPINGVMLHHSYIPTQNTWRGIITMIGTGKFYRDTRGWDRGPHLFIAKETKNPAFDGIWRGTKLDQYGIHAGECNRDHIGIEIVGNFDVKPWSPALEHVVIETTVALLLWMKRDWTHVNGHRECKSPKSCPGKKVNMDQVREKIRKRMEQP